jgi:hypothetical protein
MSESSVTQSLFDGTSDEGLVTRPPTAFELDMALQEASGNLSNELCDGMDGPLPCSKLRGHTGPHYFRW